MKRLQPIVELQELHFMIHSNGRIMSYNVNVNDIDKVIMANIYTKARKARMGILQ